MNLKANVCLPPRQTARNKKKGVYIINNNDLYCVLLNAVLVESEGELEVCLPPRQIARNKKKGVYIIINNNDLYCVLLNAVLVESEGELEVCLPPRQTAERCIHNYK